MSKQTLTMLAISAISGFSSIAIADPEHEHQHPSPLTHAPIGVMGDHMHNAGEFMFSYRFMSMEMSGNLQGSDRISTDEIVTQIANPYANPPMSPPTVRVVPQEMTTNMHMLGFMYAPNDNVTLMAMVNYIDRDMQLTSYQGPMGTNQLGNFNTGSSGIGGTTLALLYRLFDSDIHHFHADFGWILPTGSVDETDEVLTPMNMRMTMRLPYSMQLGSGSHQAKLGLTYTGLTGKMSWGSQINYTSPVEDNDEGYRVGNKIYLTSWAAYELSDQISGSVRLSYKNTEQIEGADSMIRAPVTTANPDNYGVNSLDIGIGINSILFNRHRIALEYQVPINFSVRGVQMDMDSMITLGYQLAF